MTDACKTPMADHIAEFWRLLETEHVRVLVDIRRQHEDYPDGGPCYHWDGASFPDDVAKAIVADRSTAPQALAATPAVGGAYEMALADKLVKLCCAETEKQFFDCVTDNIVCIIDSLRAKPASPLRAGQDWSCVADFLDDIEVDAAGLCRWSDVANAQTLIRQSMRCVSAAPPEQPAAFEINPFANEPAPDKEPELPAARPMGQS